MINGIKEIAFITVGQSPRVDLVPDLLGDKSKGLRVVEFGVLDGMSERQIADMGPDGPEPVLVSRLENGDEATVSKRKIEEKLDSLLFKIDRMSFDVIVMLCTGWADVYSLKTPVVTPRGSIKKFFSNLIGALNSLGVVVPNEVQSKQFAYSELNRVDVSFAAASPYDSGEIYSAGEKLKDVELIFMHCMGYSEKMRLDMEKASGRPVVLARNVLKAEADRYY